MFLRGDLERCLGDIRLSWDHLLVWCSWTVILYYQFRVYYRWSCVKAKWPHNPLTVQRANWVLEVVTAERVILFWSLTSVWTKRRLVRDRKLLLVQISTPWCRKLVIAIRCLLGSLHLVWNYSIFTHTDTDFWSHHYYIGTVIFFAFWAFEHYRHLYFFFR